MDESLFLDVDAVISEVEAAPVVFEKLQQEHSQVRPRGGLLHLQSLSCRKRKITQTVDSQSK